MMMSDLLESNWISGEYLSFLKIQVAHYSLLSPYPPTPELKGRISPSIDACSLETEATVVSPVYESARQRVLARAS